MVFLSLIPNCTNPVCVLWRQREGKWKSIWVAGRAMHHSCFFKRCFTQRSLKKVVSDLTAWTSFRNAGTGWKLKLGEWVCSWLCFLFLQNDRDSSLFPWFSSVETGQGCRQRVSFSQAFLGCRVLQGVACLPAPSPVKLLVLAQPWNLALGILLAFTQAESVRGYSHPPVPSGWGDGAYWLSCVLIYTWF